jgi:hypothetical protein
MRTLKSLKREHKEFLAEVGIKSKNILLVYQDVWSFVFYNTWTKQTIDIRR